MKNRNPIVQMPAVAEGAGPNQTVSLFLSLFLLVLAFFIILVSISTLEEVKSDAVKDSLTSTFKTVLTPSTEPTEFTSQDGDVLANQPMQDEVTEIFATTFQVAKIEIVQPGKLMRVKMPASSMFVEGKREIRPVAVPVLDRIVAVLSSRPRGLRFDMEFVLGSAYASGTNLPTNETLEMARAGALAREMAGRGVPPDSVAIGIRPGSSEEVVIWFFVRGLAESRLKFEIKKPAPSEDSSPGNTEARDGSS